MKNRLDLLKRKNIGKKMLNEYRCIFSKHLTILEWIDLEEADHILSNLKNKLVNCEWEMFGDMPGINIHNSKLLFEIYDQQNDEEKVYIYSDDHIYCGLFLANAKEAFLSAFEISKIDRGNTVFLLAEDYSYYYVINYYDSTHIDFPNSFDIKRST